MARIRSIKPEFFRHEELREAEVETGLPLRLAFIGLWTCADREGRFRWRPNVLKLDILPFDDVDFSRVLHALATRGWVVHYASGTCEFGAIPTWRRHQVINNRERESEIPEPPENPEESLTSQRVPHACPTRASRDTDLHKRKGSMEGEGEYGIWNGSNTSVELDESDGKKKAEPKYAAESLAVFEHWQTVHNHGRAKLDDKRRRVIRARLKDGYSAPDLCRAIDGCRCSPHHMGQNDAGTVYDALTLILRNADQVDKFIAMADSPPIPQDKSNGQSHAETPHERFCRVNGIPAEPYSVGPGVPSVDTAVRDIRDPIDAEFRRVDPADVGAKN